MLTTPRIKEFGWSIGSAVKGVWLSGVEYVPNGMCKPSGSNTNRTGGTGVIFAIKIYTDGSKDNGSGHVGAAVNRI